MSHSPMDRVIADAQNANIESFTDRGVRYVKRFTYCTTPTCHACRSKTSGKRVPTHGPYWYFIAYYAPKQHYQLVYIGRILDTSLYRTPDGKVDWQAYESRPRRRKAKAATPESVATPPEQMQQPAF